MVDKRLVGDLPVDEFTQICKDIPRTWFREECREVHREEIAKLGEDLTGKNVLDPKDRLCIRKTFDHSQAKRISEVAAKGAIAKAAITEGVKVLLAAALAAVCVVFGLK